MTTLSGIRVVEFTHMVAGPACGQVLADLGAEVIKVEPPKGDITRSLGPDAGDITALFATTNRNKRSVRLDLKDPAQAKTAERLLRSADVAITNIDARTLAAAGISYEQLHTSHPGLIWTDVTAFGPGGPLGTDGIAQAAMGLMSITGDRDGSSFRTGASIVDISTGVWAALGVLAALENRRQNGLGDRLSVSMADVCLYMQYSQFGMAAADRSCVRRNGNHSMISCTPIFEASDGQVMTTILHDRHWASLCDLLDRADLVEHADLRTNEQRCERQGEIEELLNPAFAARFRDHWTQALRARRIPCGPVRNYDEILADEQLWASNTFFRLPAAPASSLQVASPLQFRNHELGPPSPAPALGADDAMLQSLRETATQEPEPKK